MMAMVTLTPAVATTATTLTMLMDVATTARAKTELVAKSDGRPRSTKRQQRRHRALNEQFLS